MKILRAREVVETPCKCVTCENIIAPRADIDSPRTETWFRDSLSLKEFGISGMCQECQDSVFDVED